MLHSNLIDKKSGFRALDAVEMEAVSGGQGDPGMLHIDPPNPNRNDWQPGREIPDHKACEIGGILITGAGPLVGGALGTAVSGPAGTFWGGATGLALGTALGQSFELACEKMIDDINRNAAEDAAREAAQNAANAANGGTGNGENPVGSTS